MLSYLKTLFTVSVIVLGFLTIIAAPMFFFKFFGFVGLLVGIIFLITTIIWLQEN